MVQAVAHIDDDLKIVTRARDDSGHLLRALTAATHNITRQGGGRRRRSSSNAGNPGGDGKGPKRSKRLTISAKIRAGLALPPRPMRMGMVKSFAAA